MQHLCWIIGPIKKIEGSSIENALKRQKDFPSESLSKTKACKVKLKEKGIRKRF